MRTLTALALLSTFACHTWTPSLAPSISDAVAEGGEVRLIKKSGAAVEMQKPRIVGDSLIGRDGIFPMSVAIADVSRIERSHFAPGRTAALVVGLIVAVPALWVLMLVTSGETLAPQIQ